MISQELTNITDEELEEAILDSLKKLIKIWGRVLLVKFQEKIKKLESKIKNHIILDKEIKAFLNHQLHNLYFKIENCQIIINECNFSKTSVSIFEDVEKSLQDISSEYDKVNLLFYFKKNLEYLKILENGNEENISNLLLEVCKFIKDENIILDKILPKNQFSKTDILYIYKGNIICHRNKHKIIQATAILHNQTDKEIELNVEYCTECKKYLLEYSLFEQYRNRYGVLVGNLRMVINGNFDGEYDLALESPLRLSGYNVSQKDNFSSNERHYILARIIHDGIMSKGEVIRYLSYFIRMNGARYGNQLAVKKWEQDLAFVQEYNINTQPRTIITKIKKY